MLQHLHHRCTRCHVLYVAIVQQLEQSSIAAERSQAVASEYDLKLVRLYATSKYIAWPDEASKNVAPFVIGVVDQDPFQGGLQKLAKRKVKDRPIQVVLIKSEQDYQPCHLLFVPKDAKPEIVAAVLKRTINQSVLIWFDEAEQEKSAGISCTFVRQGDSLLIEADPAELKRRNLEVDGQLLSLNLVRVIKSGKRLESQDYGPSSESRR